MPTWLLTMLLAGLMAFRTVSTLEPLEKDIYDLSPESSRMFLRCRSLDDALKALEGATTSC